jgi:hypothetical protein
MTCIYAFKESLLFLDVAAHFHNIKCVDFLGLKRKKNENGTKKACRERKKQRKAHLEKVEVPFGYHKVPAEPIAALN